MIVFSISTAGLRAMTTSAPGPVIGSTIISKQTSSLLPMMGFSLLLVSCLQLLLAFSASLPLPLLLLCYTVALYIMTCITQYDFLLIILLTPVLTTVIIVEKMVVLGTG